jgi:hypothetical protein
MLEENKGLYCIFYYYTPWKVSSLITSESEGREKEGGDGTPPAEYHVII